MGEISCFEKQNYKFNLLVKLQVSHTKTTGIGDFPLYNFKGFIYNLNMKNNEILILFVKFVLQNKIVNLIF